MALNVSGITSLLMKWLINPLMWLLIIIFMLGSILIILVLRKRKRLKYEGIEVIDLDNNKASFNVVKCGWFGKKSMLKGLWWRGKEVLKTNEGEEILDFSTEDYTEINGKRGLVFYRDSNNQDNLVPINKTFIKNKALVASIAPSSYVDSAVDIFNETVKETTEWREKLIQFAGWALVVVFSLVAIIVIIQMVKHGQETSADLLLQAGTKGAEACKDICREAVNIATNKGGAP